MRKHLNIITPCTRPENLKTIYDGLRLQAIENSISIDWHIIMDMPHYRFTQIRKEKFSEWFGDVLPTPDIFPRYEIFCTYGKGAVGHDQRNYALKYLALGDAHTMFLDDDNVLHPNFLKEISSYLGEEKIIVVSQEFKNGLLRLQSHPENVFPGKIDTAQYSFPAYLVKEIQFKLQYDGDGLFIYELFQKYKDNFVFIDKPLSYYNYLR